MKNYNDLKILQKSFENLSISESEKIQKEILSEVLKHNNCLNYCSLDGYHEEAVCIGKESNEYIVYNGEKGNKYQLKKHSNITDAIFDIISRLSESDEVKTKIHNEFVEMLTKRLSNHNHP